MRVDDGGGKLSVVVPTQTGPSWIDRCPWPVLLVLTPFAFIRYLARGLLNGMADQMVRAAFFGAMIVVPHRRL